MSTIFEKMSAINCTKFVDEVQGLKYLSWAHAWAHFKQVDPTANYKVLPYTYDTQLGYMVWTEVTTSDGITHPMWLPVLNAAFKPMKNEPYTYTVWDNKQKKNVEKSVAAASIFDINKAIMRCLVKNLAMFGLGLNYYAGEDLPFGTDKDADKPASKVIPLSKNSNVSDNELDFIYKSIKEAKTVQDLITIGKELIKPLTSTLQEKVRPTYNVRKDELTAQANTSVPATGANCTTATAA